MGLLFLAGFRLMHSVTGGGKDKPGKMINIRLLNNSVSCLGRQDFHTIRISKKRDKNIQLLKGQFLPPIDLSLLPGMSFVAKVWK